MLGIIRLDLEIYRENKCWKIYTFSAHQFAFFTGRESVLVAPAAAIMEGQTFVHDGVPIPLQETTTTAAHQFGQGTNLCKQNNILKSIVQNITIFHRLTDLAV